MKSFFHTKKGQWIGLGLLVAIVVANGWLFVPRFIRANQELTAERLTEQQLVLVESADRAADIALQRSKSQIDLAEARTKLQELENDLNHSVLILRTGKHRTELSEEVSETLRLAEVLSFTVRTYAAQSVGDTLTSAQHAHIFGMSANQARQLAEE